LFFNVLGEQFGLNAFRICDQFSYFDQLRKEYYATEETYRLFLFSYSRPPQSVGIVADEVAATFWPFRQT
jgi:hypothetical protein